MTSHEKGARVSDAWPAAAGRGAVRIAIDPGVILADAPTSERSTVRRPR